MTKRLGVMVAVGVWAALVGGVLLALGDAAGSTVVDAAGVVLLGAGLIGFFGAGIAKSRQDGLEVRTALGRSAKDALRLAWFVFKGA
jgi:hypothetical protein